ncbi:DUF5333 domain-containing protein [Jannaschia marina]|uniref:DUF5333 domain-containing protein n=1 Tax=Jannaschia marina TaxID=2741674 RepID=UPI0015C6AAE8|nr:DUF5333 domain-containing protein [Jannaschia marina]
MSVRSSALPALVALALAAPAAADRYDALRNDPQIANGVLVAAIGDIIGDTCPDLGERRTRSLLMLNSLVSRARGLGYSAGEIRAYVEDDAEKDRVKAQARQWLAQQGASTDDPASVCRVARAEIAKESTIGRLMYEK